MDELSDIIVLALGALGASALIGIALGKFMAVQSKHMDHSAHVQGYISTIYENTPHFAVQQQLARKECTVGDHGYLFMDPRSGQYESTEQMLKRHDLYHALLDYCAKGDGVQVSLRVDAHVFPHHVLEIEEFRIIAYSQYRKPFK